MQVPYKVLVANRGEIADRVLRGLRELGVRSALLYHASEANSPILSRADECYEVAGDTPTAAYLDIDQIVSICRDNRVNAVHPGYGYLAENARFAKALDDAGIAFIGPAPEVIELMGDKIGSRSFVERHGFPVAPSENFEGDLDDFKQRVRALGFPVVIKASAGGGGKGMHIVRSDDELVHAVGVAVNEAERYFADGRVYAERYIDRPRHIEVQILADHHGHCIHLWERECSVQRRFQKVIEESPAPGLSDEQRRRICEVAVGIARAASYTNAGTVEFILDESGEFYFLEMNTRIQVEHPVTEMITAQDIVAWQLRIARGEPLNIDQEQVVCRGHAIECRICAEEPENDFLPCTGRVLALNEPRGEGVRFDSGLYTGQAITSSFDPMLAKLIVHAGDRSGAIARMRESLRKLVLLGVSSNINFLQRVLGHCDFAEGKVHTGFIPDHPELLVEESPDVAELHALLAVATLTDPDYIRAGQLLPSLHRQMGQWRN